MSDGEPDLLPGYAWSFPLGDGSANVGFGIPRGGAISTQAMKQLWPELLARPHVQAVLGASATALLAHEMVRDVIAANVLPTGALNLLVGGAGDLLDSVTSDDVIAFTGSADTAARVRGHANVLARNVSVNIEADSINAALLAPDAAGGGAAFDAFVREVVREMTVKAGQKCTAIRRIFVPADKADAIAEALAARLKGTKVGDPRQEEAAHRIAWAAVKRSYVKVGGSWIGRGGN